MKHLFRIISSVVLFTMFIVIGTRIESFFWLGVLCIGTMIACRIIIAVDYAIEYPHDFEEPKR